MFLHRPLRSCIFLSLQMGWGSRAVWACFLVSVFGSLCAKTARNAARFSFSCFCWASGLLVRRVSESSFWLRVLFGQVLC